MVVDALESVCLNLYRMSITKTTAQTDSQTAHDTLVAAANARFIAGADQQILKAIDQGLFSVNCFSEDDIDPQTIGKYYSDLGYMISLPDFTQNFLISQGPSNLFGELWTDFWNNGFIPTNLTKPYRFIIAWKP